MSPGRRLARTRRRKAARSAGTMLPIVEPRKATSRRPGLGVAALADSAGAEARAAGDGSSPRYFSKSDTTACTASPGYSSASASSAPTSADSLTSTGT